MTPVFYTITAMSNLHAGSGDANYGIIDKLVQRDPITGLPVVHASSLKGAILQHFYYQPRMNDDYIDEAFGGQTSVSKRISGTPREKGKSGDFVYLEAQLLSMPVRCNHDVTPFYRVSAPGVLLELRQQMLDTGRLTTSDALVTGLEKLAALAKAAPVALHTGIPAEARLEDQNLMHITPVPTDTPELSEIRKLLGDWALVVPDKTLEQLTDNHHLPVIARNHLENGQSTTLWYEQVLPRQTRLWCTVLKPVKVKKAKDFDQRLCDSGLLQIGANASVGYGYCHVEPFKL